MVVAFVVASTGPSELAESVLHVLVVLAFVRVRDLVGARLFPDSLSLLHSFNKDA